MSDLIIRPPYALRRTLRAVHVTLGPMGVDIAPQDLRRVAEGVCIADLIAGGLKAPYACEIDGTFVSRRQWLSPVLESDGLVRFHYAGHVHGGGGSDPLRIVLTLAVIVAAPYLAPALGFAAGTAAASAITAVAAFAGTALVNAMLPPPSQAGGFSSPAQASPSYSVQLAGNRARLGQPIPKRYGQEAYYPDEVCQPYSEFDAAGDAYYCAVLCLGLGQHKVLTIELVNTDIRYFQNVSVAICGPGQTSRESPYQTFETLPEQSIVEDNIVTAPEVGTQELISAAWVGAMTPVKPGKKLNRVFFDVVLPEGLANIRLSTGEPEDRTVTLQFGYRKIDDAGQPLNAWAVLASETLIDHTTNPIRRSFGYDLPEGRYQFRMRRTLLKSDHVDHRERVVWAGLRARLNERGCKRDDCTYVAVRIRANEQLSGGAQKRIRVYSQALIPVYDPDTETWSEPQFTRNPAHAWADILHDETTGRGLPDSRIDLLTMADLADTYAERQDRFDFSFDTRRTVDEALQLVARAGRAASILRRGSIHTLVRDELQATPVALFMPRNMQKRSFTMDFGLSTDETPDAVRMTYRDGRVGGDERVVWGQIHNGRVYAYGSDDDGTPQLPPGVPPPERIQEESIAGVVGRTHALREVKFIVADAYMRRIPLQWQTELEGTLPAYGSLVGTAHDVARWGQSGDVADYDAGSLVLTTSEPLTWGTGTHYVRLQTNSGGAGDAIQVTAGASAYEMILAEAPAEMPSFADADRERTRYLFGNLADVTRYTRVRALRRRGETDVAIEGILEVPEVHSVDADLLPGPGVTQDPLPTTTIVDGDADFDPYFGAVVLLLGLEGGTLVDQSDANQALGFNGPLVVENVAPSIGDYSITFGDDAYISLSTTRYFGFSSQPWTIEGAWELTDFNGGGSVPFEPLLDFRRDQDEYGAVGVLSDSPHRLVLRKDSEEFGSDAGVSVPLHTRFESCLTWDGTTLRGFYNGALQFETTEASVNFGTQRKLRIGRNYSGSQTLDGKNYRLRITAGVCRYTADYTVPTRYPRG